MTSFPHFQASLLLEGRSCVVFGAGDAALARAADLAAAGARVVPATVPADETVLAGAFLVVIERDVSEADAVAIALAARAAPALVYAVDRPALSDLAVPAVARRGRLSVAVSTSGASPILAQRLRDEIDRVLPEGLADLTERMAALRESLRALPPEERVRALRDALAALRLDGALTLPGDDE